MPKLVGIIPAAGRGARLGPLPFSKELFPLDFQRPNKGNNTRQLPKVISQYLVERMILAGVSHILFVLGDRKQDIMQYYGGGERFGVHFAYLYQEEPKGMPFALDLARPWIVDEDIVLFGMPDTLFFPEDAFLRLLDFHLQKRSDLSLGLFPTNKPYKFGMVDFDAEGNVLTCIDKPTQTSLKYMWGIACWTQAFTLLMADYLSSRIDVEYEVVLGDVFQYSVDQGLITKALCFSQGTYWDVGTPDELMCVLRNINNIEESPHKRHRHP